MGLCGKPLGTTLVGLRTLQKKRDTTEVNGGGEKTEEIAGKSEREREGKSLPHSPIRKM